MKRVFAAVVVAAVSFLGVGLTSGPSFGGVANTPTCGETITTNTTLHHDLVNCPDNGIVIGADNIILDLNGNAIDGDGVLSDCPPENVDFCDLGVDNTAGHTGITVRGGSISDFTHGVLDEGSNNVLRGLSVSNSFGSGIALLNAHNVRVTGSFLHDNGLTQEAQGLIILFSSGNQVDGNLVSDNGDAGVSLFASDHNRVVGNNLLRNPFVGVASDGTGNEVSRNHIAGSPHGGIVVDGDHNIVSSNQMTLPGGCPDGCSFGISFEGGTDNLLASNVIIGAQYGLRVDAFAADADGTQIRDNVVQAAGAIGIVVDLEQPGPVLDTLVMGNSVTGAAVDGIQVNSASTTITRNVANHNGNLGINAIAGVTDGGGNHAAGNGNPLQCTNVKC